MATVTHLLSKQTPPRTAGSPCRGNHASVSFKVKKTAEGQSKIAVLAVDLVQYANDGLLALPVGQHFKLLRACPRFESDIPKSRTACLRKIEASMGRLRQKIAVAGREALIAHCPRLAPISSHLACGVFQQGIVWSNVMLALHEFWSSEWSKRH